MLKKILAVVLLISACVCFCACGDNGSGTSSVNSIPEVSGTDSTVSVENTSSDTVGTTSSETVSIPEYTESQDFSWTDHKGATTVVGWDTHYFNYHGRWQDTDDGKKAHWIRPYFEFNFKGESFKILGDNLNKATVSVDGTTRAQSGNGVYTVTDGEHLIRVTASDGSLLFVFKGIETSGDISRAKSRDRYVLFIGDSLTHAVESHSVVIPEALDADYTCIAMSGIAFRDGKGYYGLPTGQTQRIGMESAFFNYNAVNEVGKYEAYTFDNERQPDKIIINIGTNDALTSAAEKDSFVAKFTAFTEKLRRLYPAAEIVVALPKADHKTGWRHKIIEAAALEAETKVGNLIFIDTREWEVEISSDGVHPTVEGYALYAGLLLNSLDW